MTYGALGRALVTCAAVGAVALSGASPALGATYSGGGGSSGGDTVTWLGWASGAAAPGTVVRFTVTFTSVSNGTTEGVGMRSNGASNPWGCPGATGNAAVGTVTILCTVPAGTTSIDPYVSSYGGPGGALAWSSVEVEYPYVAPTPTPVATPTPTPSEGPVPSVEPTATPAPTPTEDTRPVSLSGEDRARLDGLGSMGAAGLGFVVFCLSALVVVVGFRRG